jgi:ribosomal protein S27AE
MARVILDKLMAGDTLVVPEKVFRPYRETSQCPLCGARSKLTQTVKGLSCGICSRAVAWE